MCSANGTKQILIYIVLTVTVDTVPQVNYIFWLKGDINILPMQYMEWQPPSRQIIHS